MPCHLGPRLLRSATLASVDEVGQIALSDTPPSGAAELDAGDAAFPEPSPYRLGVDAEVVGYLWHRHQDIGEICLHHAL